jgi:integrase/recombinase XerD
MSGVRVSELAQLKWCDLTPRSQAGQITVFGKGGKTRAILLKPKTWDALLTLRGEAGLHLPRRTDDRGGGRQGGYY